MGEYFVFVDPSHLSGHSEGEVLSTSVEFCQWSFLKNFARGSSSCVATGLWNRKKNGAWGQNMHSNKESVFKYLP